MFFEFGYLTVAPETYNPISVYRRCMYCTLYEPKVEPSRWETRESNGRSARWPAIIAGCRAAQQHEWSPCRRFVSAKRASPGGSARASHSASLLAYRSPLCARGFTCHMPRMHAQARAQVWRQHAWTHASAHHSALLAQEGAPLWGRRSGPPVPLEVGQLLLILDFGERLLLGRLGGRDRGLVLLGRAERL